MLQQVDAILRADAGGRVVLAPHRRRARLLPHRDESRRLRRAPAAGAAAADRSVIDEVRERIARASVPGLRVEFVQIMQDMIGDLSGNPSPIEIKLFGSDQAVLRADGAAR